MEIRLIIGLFEYRVLVKIASLVRMRGGTLVGMFVTRSRGFVHSAQTPAGINTSLVSTPRK